MCEHSLLIVCPLTPLESQWKTQHVKARQLDTGVGPKEHIK